MRAPRLHSARAWPAPRLGPRLAPRTRIPCGTAPLPFLHMLTSACGCACVEITGALEEQHFAPAGFQLQPMRSAHRQSTGEMQLAMFADGPYDRRAQQCGTSRAAMRASPRTIWTASPPRTRSTISWLARPTSHARATTPPSLPLRVRAGRDEIRQRKASRDLRRAVVRAERRTCRYDPRSRLDRLGRWGRLSHAALGAEGDFLPRSRHF